MFEYLNCHKIYDKEFDKKLTKTLTKTHTDSVTKTLINCLALKKVVYLYEYLDSLERFIKTKLPIEKFFTLT